MSLLPNDGRMKPVLIIPDGTMKPEDLKLLNDNGICTVEAKNPTLVKFLDPIPSAVERTRLEEAALRLSRKMLDRETFINSTRNWQDLGYADVCKLFVTCAVEGTPLDSKPTQAERDQQYFNEEKRRELARLAREEAKEERAAAKAKTAQEKKTK